MVILVVVVVGVLTVKTTARGKQRSRAQKSESGVGDSMIFSGQKANESQYRKSREMVSETVKTERESGIWCIDLSSNLTTTKVRS